MVVVINNCGNVLFQSNNYQIMDQKQPYFKKQEKSKNLNKALLMQSKSNPRILRKPSSKYLVSPKHRNGSFINHESDRNDDLNKKIHLNHQFNEKKDNALVLVRQDIECIKNLCYISPRNCPSTKRFHRMPEKAVGTPKQQISIQLMDSNSFIQLRQGLQFQLKNKIRGQKSLSRTLRQPKEYKNSSAQKSTHHTETQFKQIQFERIRKQNKELLCQNIQLNSRIMDLKDQNQYLYWQIQNLNTLLDQQKCDHQKVKQKSEQLTEEIRLIEQELKVFKEKYKKNEEKNKSYSILEHIYLKIKNQLDQMIRKNHYLENQNEKLSNKIGTLTKMVQNCPIQQINSLKKIKKQAKLRELIEITNKQNFKVHKFPMNNIQQPKTPKPNRKVEEDNYFQLSPQ